MTSSPQRPRSSTGGLLLAPGVRFFQRHSFPFKAIIISVMFMLPLLWLLNSFLQAKRELLGASALEQSGEQYARALMPALRRAQVLREQAMGEVSKLPGANPSEAGAQFGQAMTALKASDAKLGSQLDSHKAMDAALAAQTALPSTTDGLFKVYAGHGKSVAMLLSLLESVADTSGLVLDPELGSYFAMDAALVELPLLTEMVARMQSLSAASSASGQGGEVARQELGRAEALLETYEQKLVGDASKITTARPDLAGTLALGELAKQLAQFRDIATDSPGAGGVEQAGRVIALGKPLQDTLWQLQGRYADALAALLQERVSSETRGLYSTLALTGAGVLLAGYFFFAFSLVMRQGMARMSRRIEAVSDGDLRGQPREDDSVQRDELAEMLDRMAHMQVRLASTVGQVQSSADEVASASDQLSGSTADLAKRTEETAAQLQKTASSMEQMQATVASTAATTREAAVLAARNADVAERAGNEIGKVVTTMQDIQSSAQKINEIIALIDTIAFQTNILALNAAVEAARAGEQGKGFAVVAAEVRMLAQRTTGAAKEIKTLIGNSVAQTEAGAKVVRQAGDTVQDVVQSAGRMNGLLDDIARATGEQASGITLVNEAVTDLDRMTQQNAALVEETSAAAMDMGQQASVLAREVSFFKL